MRARNEVDVKCGAIDVHCSYVLILGILKSVSVFLSPRHLFLKHLVDESKFSHFVGEEGGESPYVRVCEINASLLSPFAPP